MTKTVLLVLLALAAGASRAGWESWLRADLYRASFETYAQGQVLSDVGATNGTWGVQAVPSDAEAAAASDPGLSQYIRFSTEDNGLVFTPWSTGARALKSVYASAQLSAYEEGSVPPDLTEVHPRGAFAIYASEKGATNFVGWTAAGWTNLAASSAGAVPNQWYDVMMKFVQHTNGIVNVQYRLKKRGDAEYMTLHGAGGTNTWFEAGRGASDAIVSKVELRGSGAFSCLSGNEPRRGLLIGLVPWREMLIDESVYHHGSGDWFVYDYDYEQWRLHPYVTGGDAYGINVPEGESYTGFKPKKQCSDSREVIEFTVSFMAPNDNDATPTNDVCALVRLVEMPLTDVTQVNFEHRFACMANDGWHTNTAIQADVDADYTVEVTLDRGDQTVSYRIKKGRGAEAGAYQDLLVGKHVSIADPLYTFFGGFGKVYSIKAAEQADK